MWARLIDLNLAATFFTQVETSGRDGWLRSRWWALQQTGFAPQVLTTIADELMVLFQAIASVPDADARAIGRGILDGRLDQWREQHGPRLVADTLDYVQAHWSFVANRDSEAEQLAATLQAWAGKAAIRRRWRTSHMTLPVGDSPPRAETVPHGSVRDDVGQIDPNSHHLQNL